MIEIVYRFDPRRRAARRLPATAAAALATLNAGNRRFASFLAREVGAVEARAPVPVRRVTFAIDLRGEGGRGGVPAQRPFGLVLGCADARVPVELLFGRAVNDLFVVRVAGNVISGEGLGSLEYAAHHFAETVRVVAVLGHSGCGAVSAAVDAYLAPGLYLDLAASYPLRSVIDRLAVAVRAAARVLEAIHGRGVAGHPGYRDALLEVAIGVNAAYAAYSLREEFHPDPRARVGVVYGVYDLTTRRVTAPGTAAGTGLAAPPHGLAAFRRRVAAIASGARVRALLGGPRPFRPPERNGR